MEVLAQALFGCCFLCVVVTVASDAHQFILITTPLKPKETTPHCSYPGVLSPNASKKFKRKVVICRYFYRVVRGDGRRRGCFHEAVCRGSGRTRDEGIGGKPAPPSCAPGPSVEVFLAAVSGRHCVAEKVVRGCLPLDKHQGSDVIVTGIQFNRGLRPELRCCWQRGSAEAVPCSPQNVSKTGFLARRA
jgi:hypothetical protein